jgi:hypothetical protein
MHENNDYKASEITREIWKSAENTALIFAGSAADFALNPENHWLFYTMALPNNPQERFIQTIQHTKRMQTYSGQKVINYAHKIRDIHTKIEASRSQKAGHEQKISNNAFREVGDMIIDYAIRGWEYINHKKMSLQQKEQWYQDSKYVFQNMHIQDLPETFVEWEQSRQKSIYERFTVNEFTPKLYDAYRKDLGAFRYWILIKFQAEFVHPLIKEKLNLKSNPLIKLGYKIYPYIPTQIDWKILLYLMLKPRVRKMLMAYSREK